MTSSDVHRREIAERQARQAGTLRDDEPIMVALYFASLHLNDDHEQRAVRDLADQVKHSHAREPIPVHTWEELTRTAWRLYRGLLNGTGVDGMTDGRARAIAAVMEAMLRCWAERDALAHEQRLPTSPPTIGPDSGIGL